MKEINIDVKGGKSKIMVGGKLSGLGSMLSGRNTLMVVDSNVAGIYAKELPDFPMIKIEANEKNKSLQTISNIYDFFLREGADRDTLVLGIGGGIVCDMAGFAASTYLRGLKFAYVPTTLLAQADASIGGKTGVNLHGYKNLVGTFSQPEFVLIDVGVLKTLQKEHVSNGFAEVIKMGAICDEKLFLLLEKNIKLAFALDNELMQKIIYLSAKAKAEIVQNDEKEGRERRILNFGHTFGHAIEKTKDISHGFAISMGMEIAAKISKKRGMISDNEAQRLVLLLKEYGLPVKFEGDISDLADAISKDKKKAGEKINFVMLEKIGKAKVEQISVEELKMEAGKDG